MKKSMKKKLMLAAAMALCMVPGYMNAQTAHDDDVVFECKLSVLNNGIRYYLKDVGTYMQLETDVNSATEFWFTRDKNWAYNDATLGTSYYMIGNGNCVGRAADADVISGALVYSNQTCTESSTVNSKITRVLNFNTTASPNGFVLYTKAKTNLFFTGRQWADGSAVDYKARPSPTTHYVIAIWSASQCKNIDNESFRPRG